MNDLTPDEIEILYLKGMLNDNSRLDNSSERRAGRDNVVKLGREPDRDSDGNHSGVVVPESFGQWLKQQTKEVK